MSTSHLTTCAPSLTRPAFTGAVTYTKVRVSNEERVSLGGSLTHQHAIDEAAQEVFLEQDRQFCDRHVAVTNSRGVQVRHLR